MLDWALNIGGIATALCVLVFPLWALGIPGIPDPKNDYVRGWKMGLAAIILYPIAYTGCLAAYYIGRIRLDPVAWSDWEHKCRTLILLAVAALVLRVAHGIYLVARNDKKQKAAEKDEKTPGE